MPTKMMSSPSRSRSGRVCLSVASSIQQPPRSAGRACPATMHRPGLECRDCNGSSTVGSKQTNIGPEAQRHGADYECGPCGVTCAPNNGMSSVSDGSGSDHAAGQARRIDCDRAGAVGDGGRFAGYRAYATGRTRQARVLRRDDVRDGHPVVRELSCARRRLLRTKRAVQSHEPRDHGEFLQHARVKPRCPNPFTAESDAVAQGCWPEPEVPQTMNRRELGNLQLTADEERVVVEFMKTLSDGFASTAR